MLVRPRRTLEVLSVSALDLLASALGVFILMAVLMFPYYLKQPSTELAAEGAAAAQAAAAAELDDGRRRVADAASTLATAEQGRAAAARALAAAEAALAAAEAGRRAAAGDAARAESREAELQGKLGDFTMADLDLVFVMDATGSMGEELDDVERNLLGIIRILRKLAPSLNVGFVAFKDRTDDYLARSFPPAPMQGGNLARLQRFIANIRASGGGDYPEPVADALRLAVEMPWRTGAEGRIVVVGDAPSHDADWRRAFAQAATFAKSPEAGAPARRVSTIFTGQRGAGRDFYSRLANAGEGDFVEHRGQMIESVLLSVLPDRATLGGDR